MIANYHTHTKRCNHALGVEREYIENAIASGFQTLGFADHAPMPFPGNYYSGFRMKLHELEEYVETLRGLQKEYEKDIRILIGLEAEYYPALFEDFMAFIRPFSLDYLIMGQHALENEENALFCGTPTDDPALLKRYVDQVITGLSTGAFAYHAHPDIFRFEGDPAVYEAEITRYLTFCKENGIPLEINLLGLMEDRWYPREDFWRLAAKVGNWAIIGCDAHRPEVMSDKALHQKGKDWAQRFGVPVLPQLSI